MLVAINLDLDLQRMRTAGTSPRRMVAELAARCWTCGAKTHRKADWGADQPEAGEGSEVRAGQQLGR